LQHKTDIVANLFRLLAFKILKIQRESSLEASEIKLNQLFNTDRFSTDTVDNRMSILIVDDEESILRSLSCSLDTLDNTYRVETASSAEEALEIMADCPFDLVITDLRLPEMDGLELTENLYKNNPDTSSILMTAYGNEKISKTAKKQGCLYLEKPFNIDQLIEQINMAFNRRGRFRVSLPDVTLTDIVRLYQYNNDSAVLSIVAENTAGMMVIEAGRITHVRLDETEGPEALLKILDLKSGSINALSCAIPQRETLSVSAERLEAAICSEHPLERLRLIWLADGLVSQLERNNDLDKQWHEDSKISSKQKMELPLRVPKNFTNNKENDLKDLALGPEEEISSTEPLASSALAESREEIKLLIHAGVEHFKAKRLDEAKDTWSKALTLDPDCNEAKRNLAILEQVLGLLEKDS